MSFTLLSVVILGITAVLIYGQAVKGYKQGMTRSFVNLAILIVCAFFGALLSSGIAALLSQPITNLVRESDLYREIERFAGDMYMVVSIVVRAVFSLLLYIPMFFILRGVVLLCVKIAFRKQDKVYLRRDTRYVSENESFYSKYDKKIGAFSGIVSGFVLAIVIFMPITGVLRSCNSAVDIAKNFDNLRTSINQIEDIKLLDKYSNDFSVTLIDACGGGAIYDVVTIMSADGETTNVNKEIETIKNIEFNEMMLMFKNSFKVTDETLNATEDMLDDINESVFLKRFTVQMIRNASTKWLDHKAYAGIKRLDMNGNVRMDTILDEVLLAFSSTTVESYKEDVMAAMRVMKILIENRSILNGDNYDMLMRALEDSSFLQDIENELKKSANMAAVGDRVAKIFLSDIAKEIMNDYKYSSLARQTLYSELAESVNKTQGLSQKARVSAISSYVVQSFNSYGMYVPSTLSETLAEEFSKEFPQSSGKVNSKYIEIFFNNCIQGGY